MLNRIRKVPYPNWIGSKKMLKHLDDFLLYLKTNNYSEQTIQSYERDLMTFVEYLSQQGVDFGKMTRRDVEEYKAYLRSRDRKTLKELSEEEVNSRSENETTDLLSVRSINRMLSSLRSYLKYLTKNGYSVPLSRDEVELIRSPRKKARVAELDDLIRLIEAPMQFEKKKMIALRNRAILEVLFATGMRISELIRLERKQVDESGRIFIKGKGRKERFVYLTPRSLHHLNEYLKKRADDSPALLVPFGGKYRNHPKKRLTKSYVQKKIKEYVLRLGINVPTSAHSLRHGFGTYLAEQGASPVAIQILLGHESPATTDRYIHAADRFAEKQHKKYHPLYKEDEKY